MLTTLLNSSPSFTHQLRRVASARAKASILDATAVTEYDFPLIPHVKGALDEDIG